MTDDERNELKEMRLLIESFIEEVREDAIERDRKFRSLQQTADINRRAVRRTSQEIERIRSGSSGSWAALVARDIGGGYRPPQPPR